MTVGHGPVVHQKADIFTNPLRRLEFNRQRSVLRVQNVERLGPEACETRKRLLKDKRTEWSMEQRRSKPIWGLETSTVTLADLYNR